MVHGRLCAVGRTGRLNWLADAETRQFVSTAALAQSSLGIAHAAAVGGHLLYGFNREWVSSARLGREVSEA